MRRVLDVARIQFVHWPAVLAYPLAVLVFMPVLGLVIDVSNGPAGAAGSPHEIFLLPVVYSLAATAHLQTMTQVFPFALGLGVTRRAFYAATGLVVLAQSALFGLLLLGFGRIERMTGWGRHIRVFEPDILRQNNPAGQFLVYTTPFVAVSAAAVLIGIVFHRWRQVGVLLAIAASVVLLAGAGALATTQDWWPEVGRFLTAQPSLALFAGYPLVLAAGCAGAAWLAIRRATP